MKRVNCIFLIFSFFPLFFLTNCDTGKEKQGMIEVYMDKASEIPLFKDFEYVRLETKEEGLIHYIEKIMIEDESIIIHSVLDGLIAVFNSDGEFQFRFPVGNGPGELIYPTDIDIDRSTGNLLVLDRYVTLKEYTLGGKYLGNVVSTEHGYIKIKKTNNSILFFDSNISRNNDYSFYFVQGENSYEYVKKDDRFRELLYLPTSAFSEINDSIVYFNHQFEDLIYSWNSHTHSLDVAYEIVFKDRESIASWKGDYVLKNGRNEEYQIAYENKKYIFGIKNFYTLDHFIFFCAEDQSMKYCLYNMKSKKLAISTKIIDGFPEIRKFFRGPGNSLLFTLSADEIKEFCENSPVENKNERLMELSGRISFDDNPVLFVVK